MTSVLLIDKVGNKKTTNVKKFNLELLYKKCNFRNNLNFKKRWTWKISEGVYISLYSKDKGRSNNINKFDLPPPIDKTLYYGSIIVVKHNDKHIDNNNVEDITLMEWETFYEKLFGGFEDLGEEDSFSEDEIIPEEYKTKEGYSKEDGFIVDSDEEDKDYNPDDSDNLEELSEYDSNENIDGTDEEDALENSHEDIEDEDEEEDDDEDDEEEEEESDYDDDDCGSELSEEEYIDE